jgi:hypothetical protein
MEHLSLPVLDGNETEVVTREVLEVERLQDGGFRLLHSPAYVWGVAAGDVIDLVPTELAGFRVRSRAGNVAVVLTLKDLADKSSDLVRELMAQVNSLGGVCEGGPGRALVFTVPVSAGFGSIESTFNVFCGGLEGAAWWYGNVLDRHDRPLGWWEG